MLNVCYHDALAGEAVPLVPTLQREPLEHSHTDTDVESMGCAFRNSFVRSEDDRLRGSIHFIHQNLHDAVGVQDVIRHVGVSRRWLEYAFRDALGVSPYQYLRRVRLELARSLLMSEPRKKVYQIARCTGFSSARQFTMTFRQYFGFSPTDCRRNTQESAQGDVSSDPTIDIPREACRPRGPAKNVHTDDKTHED